MKRSDAHAVPEVEAVRVLALGPHAGVQVQLPAALTGRLGLDPGHHRAGVAAAAEGRPGREVVDVAEAPARGVLADPEAGDRGRLISLEGHGDAIATGA